MMVVHDPVDRAVVVFVGSREEADSVLRAASRALKTPRGRLLDAIRSAQHHLSCLTVEESETNTDWERVEAAKAELREAEDLIS